MSSVNFLVYGTVEKVVLSSSYAKQANTTCHIG